MNNSTVSSVSRFQDLYAQYAIFEVRILPLAKSLQEEDPGYAAKTAAEFGALTQQLRAVASAVNLNEQIDLETFLRLSKWRKMEMKDLPDPILGMLATRDENLSDSYLEGTSDGGSWGIFTPLNNLAKKFDRLQAVRILGKRLFTNLNNKQLLNVSLAVFKFGDEGLKAQFATGMKSSLPPYRVQQLVDRIHQKYTQYFDGFVHWTIRFNRDEFPIFQRIIPYVGKDSWYGSDLNGLVKSLPKLSPQERQQVIFTVSIFKDRELKPTESVGLPSFYYHDGSPWKTWEKLAQRWHANPENIVVPGAQHNSPVLGDQEAFDLFYEVTGGLDGSEVYDLCDDPQRLVAFAGTKQAAIGICQIYLTHPDAGDAMSGGRKAVESCLQRLLA